MGNTLLLAAAAARRRVLSPSDLSPAPTLWLEAAAGSLYRRNATGAVDDGGSGWNGLGDGTTSIAAPGWAGSVGDLLLLTGLDNGFPDGTYEVVDDGSPDFPVIALDTGEGVGVAGGTWRDVTLADVGDPVGLWLDQRDTIATLAYPHLEQATGANRPTVATNGAGLVVRGNGTSQFMTSSPTVAPQAATVSWAGKITGPDPGRPWGLGFTRSPFYRSGTYWFFAHQGTTSVDTGLAAASLAVVTYRLETDVAHLPRRNGTNGAVTLRPDVGFPATGLHLFSDDASEFGAADLASFVVVPSILSDATSRLLEDYLNARPGVGVY